MEKIIKMGLTLSKVFSIVRGVSLVIPGARRVMQKSSTEHKLRDIACDYAGYDYIDNKFRLGYKEPRGLLHGYGLYLGTYLAEGAIGLAKEIVQSLNGK